MKKKMLLGVSLMLSCALLVSCSTEKEIIGEIIEVHIDELAGIEEYVVLTKKGETIGLTATSGTAMFSWVDSLDVEDLKSGEQIGAVVSAKCDRKRTTIVTNDGKKIRAYPATSIAVEESVMRGAYTLADGTVLTRRDTIFDRFSYELPDGTELLWGEVPNPENNLSGGTLEDRSDLSEEAKDKIAAYLSKHGPFYDLDKSLENAYADYINASETKRDFRANIMLQENRLLEGNGHYVTCSVRLSTPAEQYYTGVAEEDEFFVIFDTQTGEVVPLWDMFKVSEEQARRTLGKHCVANNVSTTAEEYANAIDPEHVCWSSEGFDIYFPAGTFQEHEHKLVVSIDTAQIKSILTDNAL